MLVTHVWLEFIACSRQKLRIFCLKLGNFRSKLVPIISQFCAGDVFYARWDEILVGATAVVSTLGGFGNEEQMKKINGEANILAVDTAKEYGKNHEIPFNLHNLYKYF